jgi:hypothetical protein
MYVLGMRSLHQVAVLRLGRGKVPFTVCGNGSSALSGPQVEVPLARI